MHPARLRPQLLIVIAGFIAPVALLEDIQVVFSTWARPLPCSGQPGGLRLTADLDGAAHSTGQDESELFFQRPPLCG